MVEIHFTIFAVRDVRPHAKNAVFLNLPSGLFTLINELRFTKFAVADLAVIEHIRFTEFAVGDYFPSWEILFTKLAVRDVRLHVNIAFY